MPVAHAASSVEQAFRDAAFQIDDAAAGLDVHCTPFACAVIPYVWYTVHHQSLFFLINHQRLPDAIDRTSPGAATGVGRCKEAGAGVSRPERCQRQSLGRRNATLVGDW